MSRQSEIQLMWTRVDEMIERVADGPNVAHRLKEEAREELEAALMTLPDHGDNEILMWLQGLLDGSKVTENGEWD